MAGERKGWIPCKATKGLFEEEAFVILDWLAAPVSAILNQECLAHKPKGADLEDNHVVSYIIGTKGDDFIVELPGEPVVGGLRAIVSKDMISMAEEQTA